MSTDLRRLADAKRHLFACIIAGAHLLDTPFTNAPDQTPWSRMKHAMEGLDAAVKTLTAAPSTYTLPAEPPPEVTELWNADGDSWCRLDVPFASGEGWVHRDTLPTEADITLAAVHWDELIYEQRRLSTVRGYSRCLPRD